MCLEFGVEWTISTALNGNNGAIQSDNIDHHGLG